MIDKQQPAKPFCDTIPDNPSYATIAQLSNDPQIQSDGSQLFLRHRYKEGSVHLSGPYKTLPDLVVSEFTGIGISPEVVERCFWTTQWLPQ